MAVAFDAVGPSASGTTSATSPLTWTHVCGASATHLLVGATWDGNPDGGGSLSATYNSVSMTSLGVWHCGGGTAGFLQVWALASPATGSHSVSVTAGGSPGGINAGSVSFTGSSALSAVQSAVSAGAATNPSLTFTGSVSGNVVAAFVGGGSPQTPTGSFTSRYNENAGSGQQGAGYTACSTIASPGGSTTASWTMNSDFSAVAAVEVQAGAAAATVLPIRPYRTRRPRRYLPVRRRLLAVPLPPQTFQPTAALSGSGSLTAITAPVITAIGGSGAASYFTDQIGRPRLVIGDESWGLPANAGRWTSGDWQGTYDAYLTARAAQGFTVIYNKPMGNTVTGGVSDNGNTHDGVAPFTTGQDPSSGLNATFWTRIDYYLASAASLGLTVFFNLGQSYDEATGGLQAGWTTTQWSDFGAAMGNRYKTTPNIVWVIGDDSFGGDDSKWDALLSGIRGTGDTHAIAPEYYPESTSRRDLASNGALSWGGSNAQWNFVYSYNVSYFGVEQAYLESSPVLVLRADGYFYQNQGTTAEELLVRSLFWWALSSGSRGFIFGSEAIWQWPTGAAAATTAETFFATTAGAIRAAFEALPGWHLLIPDTSSVLVTAGRGTRATSLSSGGGGGSYTGSTDAYVSASLVPDGSLAVIYMSHGSTITVDESKMTAGYAAYWVDPVTGTKTLGTAGSTYNSTARGSNSAGGPDWVLVLQSASSVSGTASLSGSGILTASPQLAAAAALSGSGTLTAAAQAGATAALSGAGTLSVSGLTLGTAAALTGLGTLTAAPKLLAAASLSGLGTLAAGPAVTGAVSLSGSGTLSAAPRLAASAALSGSGTLSAAPTAPASASLSGAGTLTAGPALTGAAALSGLGTLTAAPVLAGSATLSGTGTLSAAPAGAAAASLSGSGTLSTVWALRATVALSGSGTLSYAQGQAAASLSGTGTLVAVPGLSGTAALSGAGTLSAPWALVLPGAAALSGQGSLAAALRLGITASLSGTGTLTALVLPPLARATSAPVVSAGATSAPAVAGASPGPQVSARATSAPSVS